MIIIIPPDILFTSGSRQVGSSLSRSISGPTKVPWLLYLFRYFFPLPFYAFFPFQELSPQGWRYFLIDTAAVAVFVRASLPGPSRSIEIFLKIGVPFEGNVFSLRGPVWPLGRPSTLLYGRHPVFDPPFCRSVEQVPLPLSILAFASYYPRLSLIFTLLPTVASSVLSP